VRWLADECVTVSLVRELRGAGHDVIYIAEFAASLSDVEVIALALREGRLLLTADKDFGELVFRRGQAVPGLVLLRIDPENGPLVRTRLLDAVDQFGQSLFGRYVVIDEVRLRTRPL
jgi:predicted nuclease of predicted toxin-antitoxin system